MLTVLETVAPGGDYEDAERFWIASLRAAGVLVINVAAGGDGTTGTPVLAVTREKISRGRRGKCVPKAALMRGQEARVPKIHAMGVGPKNTSGFKGVSWSARDARYSAKIAHRHVGTFRSAEEAARAYDDAARSAWGADAALNFPRPGERSARP